jgi:hypothetical protein
LPLPPEPADPLDPVPPAPLDPELVVVAAPPEPPEEEDVVVELPEEPPEELLVELPPWPPSGFLGGASKSRDPLPHAATTNIAPENRASQAVDFIELCIECSLLNLLPPRLDPKTIRASYAIGRRCAGRIVASRQRAMRRGRIESPVRDSW